MNGLFDRTKRRISRPSMDWVGTFLIAVAVLATVLECWNHDRRRAERQSLARQMVARASGRREKAREYRQLHQIHLKQLERLHRALASAPDPDWIDRLSSCTGPTPRETLEHLTELVPWEAKMASTLEWLADHPAESFTSEPPRPLDPLQRRKGLMPFSIRAVDISPADRKVFGQSFAAPDLKKPE